MAKHQMAKHCVKTKYIWDLLSRNLSDMGKGHKTLNIWC